MGAADKYIESKKKMQEGGEIPQQPPMPQQPQVEELDDNNSYEVTVQDDSGLIKYRFSKNMTI